MANWSKRTSRKAGNQGQRRTYTTTSTGKSTSSYSSKVGNVRTTTSISSNGKMKITRTESNPFLGRRTTTQTLNPKPKRQKKSSGYKRKTYRGRRSGGNSGCAVILLAPFVFTLLTYGASTLI